MMTSAPHRLRTPLTLRIPSFLSTFSVPLLSSTRSLSTPYSSSFLGSSLASSSFRSLSLSPSISSPSKARKPKKTSSPDPYAHLQRISANTVAGLIGEHTFQSQEEALYEWFKKRKDTEELVRAMEQKLHRRSKHYVRQRLLQENESLQQLLRDYESTLDNAQDSNEASALYSAKTDEVNQYLVQQGFIQSYETGRFISHSALQVVHQRRGVRLEQRSIQEYERLNEATVTQRNAQQLKKPYAPHFVLTGRIDGYNETTQTILEIKTRATGGKIINPFNGNETMDVRNTDASMTSVSSSTTSSSSAPQAFPHDIIQVRCYMEMKDAEFAEISEHYQNSEPRITRVRRDPLEWDRIYRKLLDTLQNMERFVMDEDYRASIVTAGTIDIRDITGLQYSWKKNTVSPNVPRKLTAGNTKTSPSSVFPIKEGTKEGRSSVTATATNTANIVPNGTTVRTSNPTVHTPPSMNNSNDDQLLMYNNIPGLPPL